MNFFFKIVEKDKKKKYDVYKVDYKEIIYKDFQKKDISKKLVILKKKDYKKDLEDSFWEKNKNIIKSILGTFAGLGILTPFIAGLIIPGVNVLEIGFIASLFGGIVAEGGNIYLIVKRKMKTSLQKILDKEMKSMDEFEE